MSVEAVFELMKGVTEDDALRAEFDRAVAGVSGDEAASSIVEFAAGKGVEVTADDVLAATTIADAQELTDDELDNVSGGLRLSTQPRRRGSDFANVAKSGLSKTADTVMSAGQLAAPYIPGGTVLSAAVSGMGQLKTSLRG
jgi:predicted ribosomally synthesized peptide with nif11-like leader